jgi:putative heme-binding domain-containing protein
MQRSHVLGCSALLAAVTTVIAGGGRTVAAQHEPTAADIQNGQRLFQDNCVGCHGPEGDLIAGVALKSGRFRRAASDAEVASIIIKGIPSTGMPPNPFTEDQASTIVAYLRSSSPGAPVGNGTTAAPAVRSPGSPITGNTIAGQAIVEGKGKCLSCHQVNGVGSRLGPDLSDVGTRALRPPASGGVELERSLVEPDAVVAASNRYVRVVTSDNKTLTGRLLNHDRVSVLFLDTNERLVSLQKASLHEFTIVEKSAMPSYATTLTVQERADVVSYLATLKIRSQPQ